MLCEASSTNVSDVKKVAAQPILPEMVDLSKGRVDEFSYRFRNPEMAYLDLFGSQISKKDLEKVVVPSKESVTL